jgi:CxxC motif-containing protein (DUF1111 family)
LQAGQCAVESQANQNESPYLDILFHAINEMLSDPQGIGNNGQRWIHRTTGTEEASVCNVEVVNIMGAAIQV